MDDPDRTGANAPAGDERDAAARANDAFYAAFAAGDLRAMESLWARAEAVLCVHPGGPPLHGRDLVLASWRAILAAPPQIVHSDVRVAIVRGVAFVTCFESIAGQALAATNVFVWEDGGWRMTHHQASTIAALAPIPDPHSGTVH